MINLINIFKILRTGNTPTEKDWEEIFSSIWHKSEKLPISQIFGLKEEIAKATTNFKGYHTTIEELRQAYPQVENKKDFYAFAGSPYPGTVWKVFADKGAWIDTGEVPTQQEIDLVEYAKKATIINVSQLNNDYEYETSQDARNAIPKANRGLGQSVFYKLKNGRWVSEIFNGTTLLQWDDPKSWTREITALDLDYIEKSDDNIDTNNKFDKNGITPNKALSEGANGQEADLTTASISNYISITTGDKIIFNSDRVVAFYDKDKKLVAFLKAQDTDPSQEERIIEITGNYSYMRFTIMNEWIDSTYCYINFDPNTVKEINKFDKNGITPNKALSGGSGLEADLNTTSISNYIPISKGEKVRFNSDRVVAFYDKDKKLITYLKSLDDTPTQEERIIEITEDYSYMRFTIMNEWLDSTYCYVSSFAESFSGVPSTKILHDKRPINKVFTNQENEVFVDAREVLIRGKRLPNYLDGLSYNPTIYNYELRKKITNATILPDNTVVAAIGNKIVRYGLDGVETVLLEINSVSDWRCVWCHSSGSVFFSPMNSYTNGTDSSNYGLYKYDGENVTKVIQLGDRHSIWGIDEDSKGNIYAGVYSLGVNNSKLYKSTDSGNTFTVIYDWNTKHIHALAVDRLNKDALYVSVGDNYSASQNFKSIDGGVSFVPIIDGMRRQMTAILPSDDLRFFGTDHSPIGVVYKTSNDRDLEVSLRNKK